ncbi:MAG TPA: iron-sulfur cluster assembly scaffold protein [Bryobacteraceae bacterium]|nr:iron-sulfur cluster assembly scaffold protein [Bryobacteraceae bacterium]
MRHDVYYYFQQACRRDNRNSAEAMHWVDEDDARAGFALSLDANGRIAAVDYRCTTCMTLVALCEHVAEQLRGATLEQALSLSAGELLCRHPEVPTIRRSRAHLAVAAAHAALKEIYS